MKIAQINMISYGSTGKIMLQIAETAREHGHEVKTFSTVPYDKKAKGAPFGGEHHTVFGSKKENRRHYYFGGIFGNGLFSRKGTKELIKHLRAFQPDVVHLHNLHKFCINLPILFRYLKESRVKVVWTLHDCWAFTGKCPHFVLTGCDKWKSGCGGCPQTKEYPRSLIDTSKSMYKKKKKWFSELDMTIVTPSYWLAKLVKQSFLQSYPVKVIHNGIDLSIFRPTESNFRQKYGCEGKKILLGVSSGWSNRKGLDVLITLAKHLDPERYQIVLVGTSEATDSLLPSHVISIHRTQDQKELAEIYTVADVFVNPTREDTFPTVNMESLACGTPVLTFRTGGSPEILTEACGSIVDCDDVDAMEKEIVRICTESPFTSEDCRQHAENFDMYARFSDYIALYNEVARE